MKNVSNKRMHAIRKYGPKTNNKKPLSRILKTKAPISAFGKFDTVLLCPFAEILDAVNYYIIFYSITNRNPVRPHNYYVSDSPSYTAFGLNSFFFWI